MVRYSHPHRLFADRLLGKKTKKKIAKLIAVKPFSPGDDKPLGRIQEPPCFSSWALAKTKIAIVQNSAIGAYWISWYLYRSFMKTTFLILVLFGFHWTNGQSIYEVIQQVDSIGNPNLKLQLLNEYQGEISRSHDSLQAEYYYHLGMAHGMLYHPDSSTYYFNQSLEIAQKNNDLLSQIGALNGLGNVARISSENEKAKTYFEQALDLSTKQKTDQFKSWQAKLIGNLAGIFFELGDPESALKYSKEGLAISREVADKKEIATNLIRLGYCYNALKRLDSALMVNKEAATILETTGDSLGLIYQYFSIANIHKSMQDWKEATRYFEKAVDMSARFGEAETHAGSLNALAEIAMDQQDFVRSRMLLDKAIELCDENNMLFGLRKSYQLAYLLDREQKNWIAAIDNLEKYHALNDSIQKTETLKSIEEFKVKYETAEKESKIVQANAKLEQEERFRLFLLIVIAIIVLFSLVSVYLVWQKSKLRNALLSQEIDTLRAKIQSVFSKETDEIVIDEKAINKGLRRPLSEREIEILKYAISDRTNREIAEKVFVSINTVKFHLRNIYDKLGVSNRNEALEKLISRS